MSLNNPTTTCGVTVTVTNNTGQGAITFNSMPFLQNNDYTNIGFPPIVCTTLDNGTSGILLQATYIQRWTQTNQGEVPANSTTCGTATFNLPNGNQLTITWDLDAFNGGDMPQIVTGPGYSASGATTPTSNDGYNYTFNVTIAAQ